MSKTRFLKVAWSLIILCSATTVTSSAQTFTTLTHFARKKNGAAPSSLVQGINGNFYGTTQLGGTNEPWGGTVFEITPVGKLSILYSFCARTNCTDGQEPLAGLVQATNGNFYGTTLYGGTTFNGTIFEITPAGNLTTIYNFCSQPNCADGAAPEAPVIEASNGNFYGTTVAGGMNSVECSYFGSCGTIFEVTPAGKLTTLYSFCSQPSCSDGSQPSAALVQASTENFYGTTRNGGNTDGSPGYCSNVGSGCGTVFEITPAGKLTTLYSFCSQFSCTDGFEPGTLVQASNGNFYGTTTGGGTNNGGTLFEITPAGQLTTLYNFCSQPNCADGETPAAGLVDATDGNFYGTTANGGTNVSGCSNYQKNGCGTIFELSPAGELTTLYNFCSQPNCTDSFEPGTMLQATNGDFYGPTHGVPLEGGTVFSLSVGLAPFVQTLPSAGKVATEVGILGNNMRGATGVTFNGISAQFKVELPTLILTHVPPGATTGYVTVTTPTGVLTSNVPFQVIQ
jgi:uncharacterized repeat protein (TIGR03803 family)